MFTLLKNLTTKTVAVEVPSFAAALLTTELFCHFHSFSLECLAFLGIWSASSFILSKATGKAD